MGPVEKVLMGCGGLAILGVLAVVLLFLGAILGRSDVDVEPVKEPIEDILDELDEDDDLAQVQQARNRPHPTCRGPRLPSW